MYAALQEFGEQWIRPVTQEENYLVDRSENNTIVDKRTSSQKELCVEIYVCIFQMIFARDNS